MAAFKPQQLVIIDNNLQARGYSNISIVWVVFDGFDNTFSSYNGA